VESTRTGLVRRASTASEYRGSNGATQSQISRRLDGASRTDATIGRPKDLDYVAAALRQRLADGATINERLKSIQTPSARRAAVALARSTRIR
jgi:hypothetical protein